MNNGATVLTRFTADTKDFDNKTKNVDKSMKNLASGVGKAFAVTAAAVGAVTTAIGAVVKKSVEAYAEFEQLEGGLISLFGDGSAEMQRIIKQSEEAYKNLTMSQNDYLNAFQSAYPLVNAGISENADAIEYSNKMLQLSADLFNTYGGSMEQYQNAINWALKGSFVYLDNLNLGIKGTQEGFIEAANASGVLGRTIQDVSEVTSDEIIDVIEHYADAYGVLEKTANEASDTILGSINMMKASWTNFISGLSKKNADLNKLIDQLVTSVQTVAQNVIPVVMRALEGLAQALPSLIQTISEQLPDLLNSILPPLVESITILLTALVNALPGIFETLLPILINSLITITQAILQVLPTLLPVIVNGILDGLLTLLDNIDLLIDAGINLIIGLAMGLVEAIPIIIEKMPLIISKIITALNENAPKLIQAAITLIRVLANGLVSSIPSLLKSIPKIMAAIVNGFIGSLGAIVNVGKQLIQGVWEGIKNMKNWILQKIADFASSMLKGFLKVFKIGSPSKLMEDKVGQWLPKGIAVGITANAGAVTKAMNSVEREMLDTFQVSPQLANTSALHYSPTVVNNVQVNMQQDPLGQMVRDIKTFSGGSKNDYNYGMGV